MSLDPDYTLFAGAVAAGSLSAAARALNISPAMASKRLARLEERLGVRLINRTTRRLALTPVGEIFHADVCAVLDAIKLAEDRLRGIRQVPSGPLRVSAPTSFGRLHIAPRLHEFLAAYPLVALEFDLSDAYLDLVAEQIDLAIRITSDVPGSLQAHKLASNRRVLTASPDYIAKHGAPTKIADLARHTLLAADGQMPWRLVCQRRSHVVQGRSQVRTNSSEIVRELALAGVGIALRSRWDVCDELRSGRLARVLPNWEGPPDIGIYAVHLHTPNPSAAVEAFIKFLQHALIPEPWEVPRSGRVVEFRSGGSLY